MEIASLKSLYDDSPAWNLLRKNSAPYIIAFLFDSFKARHRVEIPSSELAADLVAFQDKLQEMEIEALRTAPESLLSQWASDSDQILWRSHDTETDSYVFTLRAATEEVLQFAQSLHEVNKPVAAESTLMSIFRMLEDVVMIGSGDVAAHIDRLEEKRNSLQREIDRVREAGSVQRNPYLIKEGYNQIVSMIRSLGSDFRKVEEAFREIAKDLQNARAGESMSRGDLVEYILMGDEEIRSSEQGKSFFGFLTLLNSPEQLSRLDALRDDLRKIDELAKLDLSEVMRFEHRLLAEAKRVNKTVQRLSRQLRKALDNRANAERQQQLAQIERILDAVNGNRFSIANHDEFMEIDELPSFRCLNDYRPYRPPAKLDRSQPDGFKANPDDVDSAFDSYAKLARLDLERLTDNLIAAFSQTGKTQLTIAELVAHSEPRHGIIELAGYLQIASERDCPIEKDETEVVQVIDAAGHKIGVKIPKVVFTQQAFELKANSH